MCSHYDLDAREYMSEPSRPKPFSPRGAVDGIVCDSELAKKMGFVARFGNACGMPFYASKFCNEHRQWKYLEPYLKDRPTEPWTEFFVSSANTTTNANASRTKMKMKMKMKTKIRTRTRRSKRPKLKTRKLNKHH